MDIAIVIAFMVIGAANVALGVTFLGRGIRRHQIVAVFGGLLLVWLGASLVAVGLFNAREGETEPVTLFSYGTPATAHQPYSDLPSS